MEMMKTLIDNNIEPTAVLSSWGDAQKHVKDIVNGKMLPLYNGETGADRSVGKAINDKRHHDKLRKHHADILAGHLEPSRLEAPVLFGAYQFNRNVWHMVRADRNRLIFGN
jgi:hypothetical protein